MTTILFLVSMFVVAGMLGSKIFEIKFQKTHFLSDSFRKGDEKIHKLIKQTSNKFDHYKAVSRIVVFDIAPLYVYKGLVKSKVYLSKKYNKIEENLRGRKMLRDGGSVSLFLEKLTEDRKVEKKF